jgi:hypothetical protein
MRLLPLVSSLCVAGASAAFAQPAGGTMRDAQRGQPWMESFQVDLKELTTEGENPYFILKPGYQLTLEGKESGKTVQLVITVLQETMNVAGVNTRVVEERETHGGVVVEVSRNYFAIHPRTNDVYYFGEEVDIYKNGKLDGHEGAWRHGSNNAQFGLIMPGKPAVGMRFYQEHAPKVALDRAEVVSLTERSTTPGGVFEQCVKMKETTPLERFTTEYKVYAPGVGLIEEGALKLASRKFVQNPPR